MESTRGQQAMILAAAVALLLASAGCSFYVQDKALHDTGDLAPLTGLDGQSPWLKAHLPDGGLYVLSDWLVDDAQREIRGVGVRYNARRDVVATGPFAVAVDSVAIFESNVVQKSGAVSGLTVLTVVTGSIAVYCMANPKACFGSCPTFFAADESGRPMLMAEGFSASVAPSLEDSDLDALYRTTAGAGPFSLTMTNEALETHVVRHADLLVAPRPAGGRVLAAEDGTWRQATDLQPAIRALGPEGDCTGLLAASDSRERCSAADSLYLGAKEYLELEFDHVPAGDLGLVIASRHSLLSTYLFYQGLAYLGEYAVPKLARLGSKPASETGGESIGRLLGRIEVQVPGPDGSWQTVGATGETGPLAVNTHLLPLPALDPADPRLRLRLTKGNWRLDYVALATLGAEVTPVRVSPSLVRRDGVKDPTALADLTDPARSLISLPGDRFELVYDLPGAGEQELFLESRGYYLEWMRTEWVAEQDPALAALMFTRPVLALSYLAPKFKALEPEMEGYFWGSRYAH